MRKLCVGIIIEINPNTDYGTLHSRCQLIETWRKTQKNGFGQGYISNNNYDMGQTRPLTKAIVTQLRLIKGVTEVSVRPYKIRLEKSPTYSWEELMPKIKKIFATYIPVEDF